MKIAPLDDLFADPRRLVVLQAVHNFRDMGGYPTASGDVTRWGVLYRADGLSRLSSDDIEVVRSLGLRTVVDLRSHRELAERGTFPHAQVAVDFVHQPIIDETWDHEVAREMTARNFLVQAYTQMLAEGAPRFAEAMTTLARPGALPAVFHCAAGKDRTGILAALVLGSLGVPREVILGDYALTADGMERMRTWALREFPDMADRISDAPSAMLAALPEALGDVLDVVDLEHGGVREFVRHIGVTDDTVDALAAALLHATA